MLIAFLFEAKATERFVQLFSILTFPFSIFKKSVSKTRKLFLFFPKLFLITAKLFPFIGKLFLFARNLFLILPKPFLIRSKTGKK